MPFADSLDYSNEWNLFFGGILPALSPLIVIVIGLDIMMSAIWKSEAEPDQVKHFQRIIRTHWAVGGYFIGSLVKCIPASSPLSYQCISKVLSATLSSGIL